MRESFHRRILAHIADRRYVPRQALSLAEELGVPGEEFDSFQEVITGMVDDGRVVLGVSATIDLPPLEQSVTGIFRRHHRGFGFVVPESPTERADLFVPQGNTGGALTGDIVNAEVAHDPKRKSQRRSPYIGNVVEIIQRGNRRFVGNLTRRGASWMVEVDGKHLHEAVIVRDPHANNATDGDKVVVELTQFPDAERRDLGEGVIVEVLGPHGDPHVETTAVMHAYGLPIGFPNQVSRDAQNIAIQSSVAVTEDRCDLTAEVVCTIDPSDARDFDDAIHVKHLDVAEDGAAYELGVHIADVSHYIEAGSRLDQEAFSRGNSVYLPCKVIPMVPESLSNGICSLQESVNRYCKSVFIRYDEDGNVVGCRFANTVITSKKRLTYLEAQCLIDGDERGARKHTRSDPRYPRQLIQMLKLMNELALVIQRRRLDKGMIVLDLPNVELVFDDAGKIVDVMPEDNVFTHTIIEMFMVEANEASARLFDNLNLPMIRRVHPDPPAHDLKELRQFSRVAGYNIPSNPSIEEIQSLLDVVRGKPAQHSIHLAVLKTLSKAEYATLSIGHFALACDHYTHFTSPIRRYPDLIVHRALAVYLELAAKTGSRGGRTKNNFAKVLRDDSRIPEESSLSEIAKHCSQTERNAEAAEYDLTNYFVLELLRDHLGDEFGGTVTGVTSSGVFIQIDGFLVDGFVRVTELSPGSQDNWRFNRTTGVLVAQRSGRTITIGHRITVRVIKVDPAARRIDLIIIEEDKPSGGKIAKKDKRRQPSDARTATQQMMKIKRNKRKDRFRTSR